jgi:hypothetical protein
MALVVSVEQLRTRLCLSPSGLATRLPRSGASAGSRARRSTYARGRYLRKGMGEVASRARRQGRTCGPFFVIANTAGQGLTPTRLAAVVVPLTCADVP